MKNTKKKRVFYTERDGFPYVFSSAKKLANWLAVRAKDAFRCPNGDSMEITLSIKSLTDRQVEKIELEADSVMDAI